jgi:5-(carboxyamino)imidazole ribonucleotide synthase
MLNILGDIWIDEASSVITPPPWEKILTMLSAKLHLYGKSEPKKGRKMGHINFLAASVDEALEDANKAMVTLGIKPSGK